MSETIDRKVVEMRFDNQNFERNVKQTLETSKNLNNSITDLEKNKGLETLNKKAKQMDFSHMSNGVEKVKASFSTMEAVGFSVINRLTNKAMDFGKKLVSNTIGQIKSGGIKRALNLEQAGFQVKGLAKDVMASNKQFKKADDVWKALLEDVNYAVDGTAYGLDEASKVGSQLMASNVKMGKEMKTALRGVSGMAAMTGRTYSDIGNIYTKIAGNGRMMSKELLQFSASGINAASTLTKYVNKNADVRKALIEQGLGSKQAKTVKEFAKSTTLTEQNIRTLVSAGVVDFKTFSKAMDDAFGEHATKANETYTGSLSNLKAALARVGEPIATNTFDTLKKIFNTLTPLINGMKKELGPLMDYINEIVSSVGKKLTDAMSKFTLTYEKIDGKKTITGIKEAHDRIQKLTDTIKKIGSFIGDVIQTIYNFRIVISPIKDIFTDIKKILSDVFSSDKETAMENVKSTSQKIAEFLRNILIIVEYIIRKSTPFIVKTLKVAGSGIKIIASVVFKLVEGLKNLVQYLDAVQNRKTILRTEKLSGALQILDKTVDNVKKSLAPVTNKFKEFVNSLKEAYNKGTLFSTLIKNIKQLFIDLYDVVINNKKDVANTGLLAGFMFFYKKVQKFLSKEDFAKKIATMFSTISASIKKFTKAQTKAINAKAFKDFAISIGIVAAALFIIAGIPYKKLMKAVYGLSIMVAEMALLFIIINKSISKNDLSSAFSKSIFIALVMTSIGNAIIMIAIALRIIGGLKLSNLVASAIVSFVFIITLTIIVKRLIKATKGLDIKSVAVIWILSKVYKAIAKAIIIIALALKIMSTCDIKNLAVSAVVVFAILVVLSKSVNKLIHNTKNLSPKDAVQLSTYSGIIKSLAKSIFIIAIALRLIASVNIANLVIGAVVIISMLASLFAIVNKLTKISSKANGKEFGKLVGYSLIFIALADIVTSISKALKNIAEFNIENLAAAALSVMLIIKQLLTTIQAIGKTKVSMKTVASILVLSLLLFTISKGLHDIAKFNPENLIVAAIAMAILIKYITKFVENVSELELNIKGLLAFKAIAKLISAMAGAIKTLSEIDFPGIIYGMGAMVGLLVVISKFVDHIGSMKIDMSDIGRLLAISVVLFIIASSVKMLAGISLVEGVIAIGLIVALSVAVMGLALAAKVMQPFLGVLVKFGLVLVELGAAMFLAGIGMAQLAIGLAGLVAIGPKGINTLIEMFAQLMAASTLYTIKYKEVILNAILSIVEIVIDFLVKALPKLKVIIPPLLQLVADTIPLVLDLLVESIPAIANAIIDIIIGILNVVANRVDELLGAIWNVIGATAQVFIKALGQVNPEDMAKLVLTIGLIGVVFVLLGKLKSQMVQALISIALMSVALLMLTGVFALMSLIPMDLAKTLSSLAAFLIAMGVTMVLCALVPAPAAISGVISMGIFIAGLTAILIALGALSQIPGLTWIVGEGGKLLCQLGYIIGAFISSILEGLSSNFPAIMANLSAGLIALCVGLKPFVKAISEIPLDGVVKLGLLTAMVAAITAVGFIESILAFSPLGDPIDAFNKALLKLAIGIYMFSKVTKKIDDKKILILSVALKILADVQSQLTSNKLISFFAGKVDYEGFNKGIVGMAKALKKFCKEMTDEKVDEKRMLTFAMILKNLAEVQHYMPRKGGWIQKVIGTTDAQMFTDSCTAMVDGLKQLAEKTADIKNPEKLDTFLNLIKKLVEIANNIPKKGGLKQAFTGTSDLTDFADGCEELATAFKTMANKASEIEDPKKVDTFIGWVKALAKVAKSLPKTGGIVGAWSGDTDDLDSLSDGVEAFADAFVEINKKFKKLNMDKLDTFVSMFEIIASAEKNLSDVIKANTDKKTEVYTDPISKMVDPLKEALVDIKELVNTFDLNVLTEAINVFDNIHSFIWTIGYKFANKKTMAYVNAITDVSKSMKAVAEAIKSIQSLGLKDFKFDDVKDSKSEVLNPLGGSALEITDKPKVNTKTDSNYFGGLAKAITDFGTAMKSVDLDVLKEAKQKVDLVASIKDFESNKFDKMKESINNLKDGMKAMRSLYENVDNKGKKKSLTKATWDKDKKEYEGELGEIINYTKNVKVAINSISALMKGEGKDGDKNKLATKPVAKFIKIATEFSDALKKVREAFKTVQDSATVKDAGQKIYDAMTNIGKTSVSKFLKPIREGKGKKTTVTKAFETFKSLISTEINSIGRNGDSLYGNAVISGGYIVDGLIAGIKDKSDDLANAIKKAAKGTIKAAEITLEINSPSKVFERIGKFTIAGYIKGVENGKYKMIKSTKKVFNSTIKEIKADLIKNNKTIKNLGKSFGKSIASNFGISGKKANEVAKTRLTNAAWYLYKQTDSYKEDKASFEKSYKQYKKYNKKLQGEDAKKADKDKKAYEAAKKKRKALEKAYNNAGKSKASTTKADKDASKEEKAAIKKQNASEKKRVAASNKAAKNSAKKRYEAAKKAEEKAKKKYEKSSSKIKDAKDKRKEAAQNLKDTKKQIEKNMINALIEFRNGIRDNIASYIDPSQLSTDLGVDFFSKFEKASSISAERMVYNNKKSVQAVKEYQADVKKLEDMVSKGQLSASLVSELKAGGISKWSEVKAYLQMNSSQLREVNAAWKEKETLTAEQMSREVTDKVALIERNSKDLDKLRKKGLGKAALQSISQMAPEEQRTYIDALLNATDKQFKTISDAYKKVNKEATNQANKVVATFASTGAGGKKALEKELNKATGTKASKNIAAGLYQGIKEEKEKIGDQYWNLGVYAHSRLNASVGIKSPAKKFIQSAKYMCEGLTKGLTDNQEDVIKAGQSLGNAVWKAVNERLNKAHGDGKNNTGGHAIGNKLIAHMKSTLEDTKKKDWIPAGSKIGSALIEGIAEGLKNRKKSDDIKTDIGKLCQGIARAFRKFFKVNSPSKVTSEIGSALPEGLSVGIEDKGDLAVKSAKRLSANVLSVFNNMDTDSISEPVLTPVVDISNVEAAADDIDSLLNNDTLIKASLGFDTNQNQKKNHQPQQVVNNYNNNFEQNNYSPEALSRLDIYRDTKSLLGQKLEGGLATS